MATVTVNGTVFTAIPGTTLGELLAREQLIEMPCGGRGTCGKCKVTVTGAVRAPSETEKNKLTSAELAAGVRLACRTVIEGDVAVTLADTAAAQISADGIMPEISLAPAFSFCGAAVDIGTTTLAARLYGADGKLLAEKTALNPQSAWGADVISRIDAAVKGAGAALRLATCRAIDSLIVEMAEETHIAASDIDGAVITGNTVMLHLLTGTSPEPLSHAPFAAERLFGETLSAKALGLSALAPSAQIYLPPCVAAFLGADTVTALLASDICRSPQTRLLVDIGTNGEMALWHEGRLMLCSTAAGPAFEGAGLSMGMGGKAGAVDHVTLSEGKLYPHVIGDISPVGICGSGVVDALACLLETGELDETGYLEEEPAVIQPPVTLTQNDVRMVQLAKSAIHAGIRTLLAEVGLTCGNMTELLIAGGFGSYLNIENACRIGLIPSELLSRIRVIGNAALSGAAMLLLNRAYQADLARFVAEAREVDLSTNPVFAEEYMERMMF